MKKFFASGVIIVILVCLISFGQALADNKGTAISTYAAELVSMGMEESLAQQKAKTDVAAVIGVMQADQQAVSYGFDALSERVDKLLQSDTRREAAQTALGIAEGSKDAFMGLNAENSLFVQVSIGGAPPLVKADAAFLVAQQVAEGDQSKVNRILIAPSQPGAVPAGDIISDFIPQIIRQLFRFASLAVLVAFIVSGIMFVTAHDEEEKITRAKGMIYYTLIGFAFVALAFAIVKAVTDIDFFGFI